MTNKEQSSLLQEKSFYKSKMCCRIATVIILFIVIAVLLVVGISVFSASKKKTNPTKSLPTATSTSTPTTSTSTPTTSVERIDKCFQNKTSPPCECSDDKKIDVSDLPDGAKIEGPVSLGIVIDTTGSMAEEIESVKLGASQLLQQNQKYKVFDEYLFTTFSDPDVSDVMHTRDADEALKMIKNLSGPVHGYDCSEYSLTAILKTVKKAELGSFIFVFTDASAKDPEMKRDILKIINKKMITVHFIATGLFCKIGLNYPIYKSISDAQGGHIVHLEKTQVPDVMKFLSEVMQSGKNALYRMPTTDDKLKEKINNLKACTCPPVEFKKVCVEQKIIRRVPKEL